LATGFSFFIFGFGAVLLAIILLLFVYPLPVVRQIKQRWARLFICRASWCYIRMMSLLGLLTFNYQDVARLRAAGQLVVANHPTLLDVVFLLSLMPEANCIVKSALWKNRFTFGIVSLAGYIPNDSSALVSRAIEALDSGESVIIFPEGTRTESEEAVLHYQRGAANIAVRAACAVTPVLIKCNPITLQKHSHWYEVPAKPPVFSITVMQPLVLSECIDVSRPNTVQARHLTRFLEKYYTHWLDKKELEFIKNGT